MEEEEEEAGGLKRICQAGTDRLDERLVGSDSGRLIGGGIYN